MKKDVIIVGAGLSGIGAACHLTIKNPDKSYVILESRKNYGGTWDLFKYPGFRSDSSMYSFGYSFKPWDDVKTLAKGEDIMNYLGEAMDEFNVRDKIIYNQKVVSANFSTAAGIWVITAVNPQTGEEVRYKSSLLFSCSGYYSYESGYMPEFKGSEDFKGEIVHPQDWPEDLDYENKEVVVIGSGATAVTLIPNMADKTKMITMLQRSPTYIGALPSEDELAAFIRRLLPLKAAYEVVRLKNNVFDVLFYNACQRFPEPMKKFLVKNMQKELGDFPVDPHFRPQYDPWDQRFCLAPNGDFFKVLREGKGNVVTDEVDRFTEDGIQLKSGKALRADIIITATGLNLLAFGGMELSVDNEVVNWPEKYTYKGLIISDVPNAFVFVGYTNASWTLKSDLTSEYASRVIDYMDSHDLDYFRAEITDDAVSDDPIINLQSGYVQRSAHLFPKQGKKLPWKLYQNYFLDFITLRMRPVADESLKFYKAGSLDAEPEKPMADVSHAS